MAVCQGWGSRYVDMGASTGLALGVIIVECRANLKRADLHHPRRTGKSPPKCDPTIARNVQIDVH